MIRRHLATPHLWLIALISWATTLFILSSLTPTLPTAGPQIPHLDKLLHFGYFLGGGLILATYLRLKKGTHTPPLTRFLTALIPLAIIGALDEYHQTFTPGRSGNDPLDWLADLLGSATGILLAHLIHPLLLKLSSTNPPFLEK